MIARRQRLPQLEPARRALAEGRYEAAFALLENAATRPQARATQALYHLHLAAADALYGVDGVERGLLVLRQAADADASVVRTPLYRALHWEFRALRGAPAAQVRKGVEDVDERIDPVAAYHAASALLEAGAARRARRALERLDPETLPVYLRWRRWSRLGLCLEETQQWEGAAHAFAEAFAGAAGVERELERLHLANALAELGRIPDLLLLLEELDESELTDGERAWGRYLRGRAELDLDNPNHALELLADAERLGPDEALTFDVRYAQAQALALLGRQPEAADLLEDVLVHAAPDQRPYALHERAVALLEADRLDEAESCLDELLSDPDYPRRGEALADLAEVHLRRGAPGEARLAAERALDHGAVADACLQLGNVAYEYFDLDEAVSWLEQAVSASRPGAPNWLAAQQLLADVFAQRGPGSAERLHTHARLALGHTDPASDWYLPLKDYVARARDVLGGHDRVLN